MTEDINGQKFYQITETNAYKQAFTLGQTIHVGQEFNPFFKFYETARTYPVTDALTGVAVQVDAIEWLHRAKIGAIQTSNSVLATIAWEVSQHYMMLARELLMEQIRVDEFDSAPPSRQTCLYLSDTISEAKTWAPLLGANGVVCELTCTGTIHRADSRMMVMHSEPLSTTKDRARAYWRGEATSNPRMEILFSGDTTISAIGL
jgi:hypothetical protein